MTALVYGIHAVAAVLKNPKGVAEIFVEGGNRPNARLTDLLTEAASAQLRLSYVPRDELDRMAEGGRHQGIVARLIGASPAEGLDLMELIESLDHPAFLLILDGVQDPHNLGACLRSADAAGVDAVIVPKDKAVGLTPAVRKVACGAAESIPFFQVTNLARTLRELQQAGIWLVGAAGEADSDIYQVDLKGALGLVMGAEEGGLRRLTREHCDNLVKIPMLGTVESLNVSVATGICLFEALRQRRVSK